MNADEQAWYEDRQRYGWALRNKAPWPLRLWGIRHIRAIVLNIRVHRHARRLASVGIGLGHPNGYDAWRIYAVSRGWC